jgi:hypothetical protein
MTSPTSIHIRPKPSPLRPPAPPPPPPPTTTTTTTTSTTTKVPYFVLHLPEGRAKALFTVPSDMAETLVLHPIMARGACFHLNIDVVSQGRPVLQRRRRCSNDDTNENVDGTNGDAATAVAFSFLSTEFVSPRPEETALAISERIGIRMMGVPDGSGGAAATTTMALAGLFAIR